MNDLNRHFVCSGAAVPLRDERPTVRVSPDDRFYFSHVTSEDVIEAIISSRSNAKGPDDIPVKVLKDGLPILLPVPLIIFDCSLQSGVFPSSWKHAIVRPLPKRGPLWKPMITDQ